MHKRFQYVICFMLVMMSVAPVQAAAEWFVGVGGAVGAVNQNEEVSYLGYQETRSDSTSSVGMVLRGGMDHGHMRNYLSWDILAYSNATVQTFTFSHDRLFGNQRGKFLLGLSAGIASLTWEEDDPFDSGYDWSLEGESA